MGEGVIRHAAHQTGGLFDELVVDLFAGGGGASMGIETALGRAVDVAVNHDAVAIAMHRENHPHTHHLQSDVFEVNPLVATAGRRVGLLWASPDCKHFSKAKGGKPASRKIRALAWVVVKWAKQVRPRVIMLENVEEFETWGPLCAEGRPIRKRRGETFRRWLDQLRALGYAVEWRLLRACDYGAPTIRRRLFLIGRCDGQPIVWPKPTHGEGLKPYRTAAECIDWTLPCPSIFERKRPLADRTLARIAAGIQRYVIDAADPFIVKVNHGNDFFRGQRISEPLATVTAKNGAAVVAPYLIPRYGEREGQRPRARRVDRPAPTATPTGNGATLVAPVLTKHYGGVVGHEVTKPAGTVTSRDGHALTAAHLVKLRGTCKDGQDVRKPMPTITAGGNHVAEVRAFLVKYYGNERDAHSLREPLGTVTTRDRFGLVTVAGEQYEIADIGMRMLAPRELFRAQGFPDDYVIEQAGGERITKTNQTRMVGNSVCPMVAEAIVRANLADAIGRRRAAS